MASKFNSDLSNIKEVVKTYTKIELTEDEVNAIKGSKKPANTINDILSTRALIGWTSSAHTGTDIPLPHSAP